MAQRSVIILLGNEGTRCNPGLTFHSLSMAMTMRHSLDRTTGQMKRWMHSPEKPPWVVMGCTTQIPRYKNLRRGVQHWHRQLLCSICSKDTLPSLVPANDQECWVITKARPFLPDETDLFWWTILLQPKASPIQLHSSYFPLSFNRCQTSIGMKTPSLFLVTLLFIFHRYFPQ